MDGATLNARIYAGRGKAAAKIGLSCKLFRPFDGLNPMGNQVGTLFAALNSGDSTYKKPNEPGDAMWYADLDGSLVKVGDYLQRVSDGGIWFVAGLQPLLPIMLIECNRTIRVSRATQGTQVGAAPYGGLSKTTEQDIIGAPQQLWPASILFGGKIEKTAITPMTSKMAGWRILLPASIPASPHAGDLITDDLGGRYLIDGAEGSDTGWRINAQELHV